MHQYLRSIGFSQYKKEQDIDDLLNGFEQQFFDCARRYADKNDEMNIEIRANVAGNMGICISGVLDRDGQFKRKNYYPYIWSDEASTNAQAQISRRIDGNSFSAILDDVRVGVTLIYLLDNPFDYLQQVGEGNTPQKTLTKLCGFSTEGRILLPTENQMQPEKPQADENAPESNSPFSGSDTDNTDDAAETSSPAPDSNSQNRFNPDSPNSPIASNMPNALNLFEAAKAGNTAAIEQVAFEEMSAIAEISRRLRSEDVYSIVESVFMPQGAECDLYQVVGEIIDVAHTANLYTGEGIYDLTLNVNDMIIHVAANESDLEGEPLSGRRFKGRIWLQGRIEF